MADYADTLSQGQLRALRFRADPHTRDMRCPKKTTFTRVLHEVDDDLIERVLLRWQDQILGPKQDRLIIFDGKKVRHAGVEIVNAVDSKGRFLGSVLTEAKSNEIRAARQLCGGQDLLDKILVADAMHTQEKLTLSWQPLTKLGRGVEIIFWSCSVSTRAHGFRKCWRRRPSFRKSDWI